MSTGKGGYLAATRKILDTTELIKAAVRGMPEIELMGEALFMISFRSSTLDVYRG